MNAHDHHHAAAHKDAHASAGTEGAVGKQPRVPDDPVASAAGHHHTPHFYKTRVDQFVGNLFDTKVRAIDNFAPSLARSPKAPHNFLGDAVAFAIGAAAGPFVDALALGEIAAAVIKQAIPLFASAVGKSVAGKPSDANPVDVATFATLYGQAIDKHRSIVSHKLKAQIHDEKDGKRITGALGGDLVSGHLFLTTAQATSLNAQTQRETLDAWTVAMQKVGDSKPHNEQGYSDPSTGQLHLDGLRLFANGTLDSRGEARMEKVGNAGAQLNAKRRLEDIKVQRTMNVRWEYPSHSGGFGLSVSAGGHRKEDEFGHDDRTAVAMFYNLQSLFPAPGDDAKKIQQKNDIVDRDVSKGLDKIWNKIKGQTLQGLHFTVKGD